MKKHNIMTTEQTAQLEIGNFMHKYFNNMLPDAFVTSFSTTIEPAIVIGHGQIKLIQPSFKYKGPVKWNQLPLALREIKPLKSFINQSRYDSSLLPHKNLMHLKLTFNNCNCL